MHACSRALYLFIEGKTTFAWSVSFVYRLSLYKPLYKFIWLISFGTYKFSARQA